jgi:CDP-glycerol glycerophosphotransferase (TagB/SpsB family)
MIRVAFFAALGFHGPILGPVRDALGARADTLLTGDRRAAVAFRPHVLVLAAAPHLEYFRRALPEAFIVNVRHGTIGKRGLGRLPGRASARRFDAVCVGDPMKRADYERHGARPEEFWETGYPQLDPVFRRAVPPVLPLPPGPTVLYAPTWNLGLTSATMVGDRLVDLVLAGAPGVNLLIKPHPVIGDWRPAWMARWRRMAAEHPAVHLVDDTHADVAPYLLASDVLISDASSVIFEFLPLDRPIILVTNPRHRADPAWAPDDIVWRWRDVGDEVHRAEDIPAAVARALAAPAAGRERRRAYARVLFGSLADGRAAERIAERILAAGARTAQGARPRAEGPPWARAVWHELRARLSEQRAVRRLLLGPLEGPRLAIRAWRSARPRVGGPLESAR